ncbi:adenylyl-sulfate kinase [Helicobacter cholecystus]|nr:adenylylsulfate kinase [Helicobacter cholecystus]
MVIWLMGLAGSGKSTLGRLLYTKLKSEEVDNLVYLDGDEFRKIIGAFGYDKSSRIEVAKKRAMLCEMLSSQGLIVIASSISMFKENYEFNREYIKKYFEVYIQCDMTELKRRNQKGLYSGKVKDVVGLDIEIDNPQADLTLDNREGKLEKNLEILVDFFKSHQ